MREILILIAYTLGLFFGSKLSKGKEMINVPKLNIKKETKPSKEELALANLDRYDGTKEGQVKIDGRD